METESAEFIKEKSLLASLIHESRLYHSSAEYMGLLQFTARMRNFAPFNAMLLNIQKPGLMYAASQYDWLNRFNRTIRDGSRPLLILWPFGPVAFVFDVSDTAGDDLPETVLNPFPAVGHMRECDIKWYAHTLMKKGIEVSFIEYGSGKAGNVQAKKPDDDVERKSVSDNAKLPSQYIIRVNKLHNPNTQFATLAHELAHLFLGHLGPDEYLKIPRRSIPGRDLRELEAESVSYLVCRRNGVTSKAEAYLADFVKKNETVDGMDLYHLMKVTGQVETVLCLG